MNTETMRTPGTTPASPPRTWRVGALAVTAVLLVGGTGCITASIINSAQNSAHAREVAANWVKEVDALRRKAAGDDLKSQEELVKRLQNNGHPETYKPQEATMWKEKAAAQRAAGVKP